MGSEIINLSEHRCDRFYSVPISPKQEWPARLWSAENSKSSCWKAWRGRLWSTVAKALHLRPISVR